MIIVDVYVPSVDDSFDFQLDEHATIDAVIMDMVGIISKKTGSITDGDFALYDSITKRRLHGSDTLGNAGVKEGERLILV